MRREVPLWDSNSHIHHHVHQIITQSVSTELLDYTRDELLEKGVILNMLKINNYWHELEVTGQMVVICEETHQKGGVC